MSFYLKLESYLVIVVKQLIKTEKSDTFPPFYNFSCIEKFKLGQKNTFGTQGTN